MSDKLGTDLTTGSIPKHLLTFSIPMLLGNLMQVGYNIVNTIWLGHIAENDAVGAAGVSFPIVFILLGIAIGISMATTILVSQYYGSKDYKMVEKVVNNSFSISIILGVFFTIAGILLSDMLLKLMDTPPEIFSLASGYLKITIASFVFMYLGTLITSILRGIGDTKTPLLFMGIGLLINAILDPLLIIGLGPLPKLGLNGAAYASFIAQFIATLMGMIYLNRQNHIVSFHLKKLILEKDLTLLILKIGFPSVVQQCLISIGSAFVTAFVNKFGAPAINAFSAVGRVDSIAFLPAMSMSVSAATLTGQNLGAGKPERIKDIFKWGVIMTSAITLTISLFVVLFPKLILTSFGFGDKPDVMSIGITYLRMVGASYILFAIMFISNGIINGAGHTMKTMIFSLVSLWVVRVPLAWILSGTALGLRGIWISMIASFLVTMIISLAYYSSGKWKKAVVKHNAPAPIPEFE